MDVAGLLPCWIVLAVQLVLVHPAVVMEGSCLAEIWIEGGAIILVCESPCAREEVVAFMSILWLWPSR